jgi:hypothetical protein
MDEVERERFHRLAEGFFGAVEGLTRDLREEVGRLVLAKREVEARLKAGVESAGTSESEAAAERALEAEEVACDRLAVVVGEALQRVEKIREASAGHYPSAPDPAAAPKELEKRLAELRAEGFSLDIAKFFYGLLLILLIGAITRFIDMCEAFLGHEIGSHEARRRVGETLKTILGAGADIAIGVLCAPAAIPAAFAESVIEVIEQIRATPEREARRWEALIAKGNDQRAILIQTSKRIAEEETPLLRGYVEISLDAVEEERAQIGSPSPA